jgi:YtkA-like
MLLRLVRASGRRRLTRYRRYRASARLAAAAGCAFLAAACEPARARAPEEVSLHWHLAPDPPAVGPSRLTLQLADGRGRPLAGARLQVEADMAHPGMRPVVAVASEVTPGRYQADLDFTMAGSWFILVSGEAPSGGAFSRRIDLAHVRAR